MGILVENLGNLVENLGILVWGILVENLGILEFPRFLRCFLGVMGVFFKKF